MTPYEPRHGFWNGNHVTLSTLGIRARIADRLDRLAAVRTATTLYYPEGRHACGSGQLIGWPAPASHTSARTRMLLQVGALRKERDLEARYGRRIVNGPPL